MSNAGEKTAFVIFERVGFRQEFDFNVVIDFLSKNVSSASVTILKNETIFKITNKTE